MKNRKINWEAVDWEKVFQKGKVEIFIEELFKAFLIVFGFIFLLMFDNRPRYHRYSRGRRKWW